jgi:hypothetical protein
MIKEYEKPRWNDTDRGKKELGEKPAPPQIPPGLTGAQTKVSAVRDGRLTA